jgi:hypothetical protein
MKTREILRELEFNTGVFPRRAVEGAIANRQQITPELLRILREARQNVKKLVDQEDYLAHIYAMYLLAQFRESRAYPLIVDFFSMPGEVSLDLTGDLVTETLGRILASVCHGDVSLIKQLVEDENANEYVRDAALEALLVLVARGVKSREEVMTYYQSLFRGELIREPAHIWDGLVSCSVDLYPEEVLQDIKRAYDDGLVDEGFIGFESVEETLALGKEKTLENLKGDTRNRFIVDTIGEMEWWACFDAPKRRGEGSTKRKVGRNDPCPCGSGKKYKRCCGRPGGGS